MTPEAGTDLEGGARCRPVRVAFLVESGDFGDLTLDAIFANAYSRWGGRFSLIVPCVGGRIIDDYWSWLEVFDPDIVYSYVRLEESSVIDVHERIAPADYIFHRVHGDLPATARSFTPKFNFSPLSSASVLFRLARFSPTTEGPKVRVLDSWHTEKPSRFLTDNFGIFQNVQMGLFPNDARGTAGLVTVVSDKFFNDRTYGVPRDLNRVATEDVAFSSFANRYATSVSLLSTFYSPRLEIHDYDWSTSFNLVVGDGFEDRLLFWNARLLIPGWLDTDLCCLRVTLDQVKDEAFLRVLAKLLNERNRVNNGSGGQASISVRSASHTVEELESVLQALKEARVWSASGPVAVVPGGHVIPNRRSLTSARDRSQAIEDRSMGNTWDSYRWRPPVAVPPAISPEHLRDAPSGQGFTLGLWALDLSFECARDGLRPARGNNWRLPKRWRMSGAFSPRFTKQGVLSELPTLSRTNRHGNVSVFAGCNRMLESITVPSLESALQRAFCGDHPIWSRAADDPPWPPEKARWMRPSNENSHLSGVLGMTGGLSTASLYLLHPFFRSMFAEFGGAPNLADTGLAATEATLLKLTRRRATFDLKLPSDLSFLASLVAKAAQGIKSPKTYMSLDVLRERWKTYREEYWRERPQEGAGLSEDDIDWGRQEEESLEECLGHMRERRILFQGYPWTCRACQHKNWVDFQALKTYISCDVCRSETALPVGVPWFFRPNEFLIESLRSHSVLSVVWVLAVLRERTLSSFMYVGPTCFGYSDESADPDAEADLLLLLDGEAVLCEVKSAWRSLRKVHIDDFVEQAKRLRPDLAILAVMEDESRFVTDLAKAQADLNEHGIKFELLTPSKWQPPDGPFLLGV
jgi:hypothetical protein